MKLLYLILFLTSIMGRELVMDVALLDNLKICLHDCDYEENSEKENQKSFEDENQIESFNKNYNLSQDNKETSKCHMAVLGFSILNPFIEIHFPPPEL